jgi:hypothetical protein
MSLKHFHIAFVAICVACAIGFAAWCLMTPGLSASFRWMGGLSLVGGIGFLYYGVRFIRKVRNIIL